MGLVRFWEWIWDKIGLKNEAEVLLNGISA